MVIAGSVILLHMSRQSFTMVSDIFLRIETKIVYVNNVGVFHTL